MADYSGRTGTIFVFLFGILVVHFITAKSEDIVLLDTTQMGAGANLNWTTKIVPAIPPDASNKGWNEVSIYIQPTSEDPPLKVYTSCYVSSHQVNNWLRTPYIAVDRAESLYLNMTFRMRKCVRHSDPSTLQQCRETFNLYSYEAAKDIANNEMPSWDDTSYTLVDKIPAKILSEETTDVLLNSETRFITLKQLQGIYFAFQDEGACMTLVALKIYYKVCPYTVFNYASFPVTPTGPTSSSSIKTVGTCVANSSQVQKPIYHCMSDGTWDVPLGMCQCDPGYAAVDGEKCVACGGDYFKWQSGNMSCSPCPNNSYTPEEHSTECRCMDHFFHADTDDKNMPCTKPPSEPRDLRVIAKSDTAVTLSWSPPADLGGRLDVTYEVECLACGSDVMVSPKSFGFNSTSVELTQLKSSTSYKVTIYSRNGVTSLTTLPRKSAQISFTTDTSLAEIQNIRVANAGDTYISLTWEVLGVPITQTVVQYEVNYSIRGQQSSNSTFTETNSITIKELVKDTEYAIKVRGRTSQKGWGEYSQPFYYATRIPDDVKNELEATPSVGIIVGAIVAVILCMAIAAIMILLLLRRNRRNDEKSSDIDGPYHHVLHCTPHESHINGSMTVPLFQPTGTIKSYVDPHTYEDPNQAVREFTREIDASHITIESVIGGGEFGDVCKGKLRIPSRPEMTVAIKTLKPGATEKNRLDFLTEASIMGQFDDPNVIFLEGVVTKASPIMIVTEYMANGSLDSFLRNNDGQLTVIQLVGMMRGIASGMRYLSEMGYVHRDLAARNILCNESLVCKVADFGLSREVDIDTTDGAYTTKGGKIPVRWTAPEAIAFRKFTTASDVWSFGVVMWEVISYGERPYWNWPNQDVIKAVEKGYRLPPPMECPEAIHNLMLETWHKDRNIRPKFVNIVKSLDKLIRAPEQLRKMAKPRLQVYMDNSPQDVSNFTTVDDWLNFIKMERYRDNFASHAITGMDQVMRLTAKDMETLGITLLGHQKKVMNSVQSMRAQLLGPQVHLPHVQVSEGLLV